MQLLFLISLNKFMFTNEILKHSCEILEHKFPEELRDMLSLFSVTTVLFYL